MIDINNTLDLIKLKFYNEWLYTAHIYDEGDSQMHEKLTEQVVSQYIDPLNIPKDATILDMGSGPGYFLDQMTARGYTNLTGVGLSPGDNALCEKKGYTIKKYDINKTFIVDQFIKKYDINKNYLLDSDVLKSNPRRYATSLILV